MYDYHKEHNNALTFILASKQISVPYGVLDLDKDGAVKCLKEKPKFDFLVNTGIYLMEPIVFDLIQAHERIDLPDVAGRLMAEGYRVGGYPITEKSWLDMGQLSEMQNMMKELGI